MGQNSEVIISIFGILDVTGEVIVMWCILAIVALLSWLVTRNLKERPSKFQNVFEYAIEYLDNFFSGILGTKKARKHFTFLASLFIFIIASNYSGLIPGVGLTPYLKAPTASLSVTAGLGIVAFTFLQFASLKMGAKHYFKRFITPAAFMLPILILDEIIKPVSLALRLYGNVFGEETVTHELYSLLPIGAPIIMMALSLLFCAIQAVVFTMLVSIYLDEATELEEIPLKPKKIKKLKKSAK